MLDSPMFTARWRWNASRALAVLRFSQGRKFRRQIQRMRSDDLLAAVFPDQAACGDNIVGEIQIPDHPLVNETIRDCLHEAMDLEGLKTLLRRIDSGEILTVAIDTAEPSPFSHEILMRIHMPISTTRLLKKDVPARYRCGARLVRRPGISALWIPQQSTKSSASPGQS